MTIGEAITEQTNRLDLEHLTEAQSQWLHMVRTLATWVWIAKTRRALEKAKRK